jgi:hypothetical protein
LLAFTFDGQERMTNDLFLVLDSIPIRVPGTFTKRIEMLFAFFYAFNVKYPASLENVYQFMESQFGFPRGRQVGGHRKTVTDFTKIIKRHLALRESKLKI